MANVNIHSIMSKVNGYAGSKHGKEKMKQYIATCRTEGREKTESGGIIITEATMARAAEILISMLQESASQYRLPESVRAHFSSLAYSQPVPCGGGVNKYQCDITFKDDLSRMSLLITSGKRAGQRTGDGIDNIVSLFDTGYNAKKRVYGVWEGHGNDVRASLMHRDGLNFMRDTIDSFNREYGDMYHVHAYISADNGRFYSSGKDGD